MWNLVGAGQVVTQKRNIFIAEDGRDGLKWWSRDHIHTLKHPE